MLLKSLELVYLIGDLLKSMEILKEIMEVERQFILDLMKKMQQLK